MTTITSAVCMCVRSWSRLVKFLYFISHGIICQNALSHDREYQSVRLRARSIKRSTICSRLIWLAFLDNTTSIVDPPRDSLQQSTVIHSFDVIKKDKRCHKSQYLAGSSAVRQLRGRAHFDRYYNNSVWHGYYTTTANLHQPNGDICVI